MSAASHNAARSEPGAIAYNLAGIAVIVLLLAVGLAYLLDQAGRTSPSVRPVLGDAAPVTQTISGRELDIPASWFRFGEQMRGGFASQVDLRFVLSLDTGATTVDVTLLPRSRARSSAALLDTVYLHQFAEGSEAGVEGLVGKRMLAEEGYSGETVWYDPLSPSPFVAKCADAIAPTQTARCLRTIHLQSGLAAVLSFDATALQSWRSFDEELARWLGQIGAL